jgi:hypothetical protein
MTPVTRKASPITGRLGAVASVAKLVHTPVTLNFIDFLETQGGCQWYRKPVWHCTGSAAAQARTPGPSRASSHSASGSLLVGP